MKIINSKERAKIVTGVKIVIFGPYGIGKTSLLKTLDESTTLCLDFEAGLLAVQDWQGDSVSIRTWNPNYGLNKEIKVQLRRGKQGKLEYFSNN